MNTGDEVPPVRPPPSAGGSAVEPGALTDVVFDGYVGYSNRAIRVAIAIAFFFILILLAVMVPGGFTTRFAVCCVAALAAVLLIASWRQKRARTMAQETVAAVSHEGVASAMRSMLDSTHGISVASGLHATLSLLAEQGHGRTTLRICKTNEMVALEPLTYPFEPAAERDALGAHPTAVRRGRVCTGPASQRGASVCTEHRSQGRLGRDGAFGV